MPIDGKIINIKNKINKFRGKKNKQTGVCSIHKNSDQNTELKGQMEKQKRLQI